MILIGELRDAETAQTALQVAQSALRRPAHDRRGRDRRPDDRVLPHEKQQQIHLSSPASCAASSASGCSPASGVAGVAAVEVMVMNSRIADLIREERTEEIADAVAEGSFFDMQTFEQALIDLVLAGMALQREVAANAATNVHDFEVALDYALKSQTVEIGDRAGRRGGRSPQRREERSAQPPRRPPRGGATRLAAAAALLALALGVGTASADMFAVVPNSFAVVPEGPVSYLPSAEVPRNPTGSIGGAAARSLEAPFVPAGELSVPGAAGALGARRRR